MKLKEFVQNFICKNTKIRLWTPIKGGHKLITDKNVKDVCMEWELLNGSVWQSKYNDCDVFGVTDIVIDTNREAVNIVIDKE